MDHAKALEQLLRRSFSVIELRQWVELNMPEVADDLPGEGVSRRQLSQALVLSLESNQLAADKLFEILLAERPRRQVEIDHVRALYAAAPKQAPPRAGDVSARPAEAWRARFRICRAVTLGLLAIWLLTRGYPALDASRALITAERGLFGFLPLPYQRLGLLASVLVAALCTLLCWAAARAHRLRRT